MKKVSCVSGKTKENAPKGDLKWWQLSLIGIGCTIGTGYFLGSGIGVKITGPAIVFSFLLAAIGTYVVYHFLAMMTTEDPQEGSFCYYAGKAFGRWGGFSCLMELLDFENINYRKSVNGTSHSFSILVP